MALLIFPFTVVDPVFVFELRSIEKETNNGPVLDTLEHSDKKIQTLSAPLQEVFSSIQGEGIYVGQRQVFVRFAHCHLKCHYCDTAMMTEDGRFHAETAPGSSEIAFHENPVSTATLLHAINHLLTQGKHHSISFTGGEPLLYHRFLKSVFQSLKSSSSHSETTYLETSGTQPEFLAEVLPWTDIIAMDIKLPSATGERPLFEEHKAFLAVAATRPKTQVFIKVVFNPAIDPKTLEHELNAVKETVQNRTLPLILQPMTSLTDNQVHLNPEETLRLQDQMTQWFDDVRVIPQTHKMIQVR